MCVPKKCSNLEPEPPGSSLKKIFDFRYHSNSNQMEASKTAIYFRASSFSPIIWKYNILNSDPDYSSMSLLAFLRRCSKLLPLVAMQVSAHLLMLLTAFLILSGCRCSACECYHFFQIWQWPCQIVWLKGSCWWGCPCTASWTLGGHRSGCQACRAEG